MAIRAEATAFRECLLISVDRFEDPRGRFTEHYNRGAFADIGVGCEFVQDNQSVSVEPETVRGLHFQAPPFAQAKLVRVLRGAIFDVAVDIRVGSPTFGRSTSFVLEANAPQQAFIPEGFAHSFCTLEPDTEVFYEVSAPYSRDHDCGLRWNDPQLAIDWPVSADDAILSDKDLRSPLLAELTSPFVYMPTPR